MLRKILKYALRALIVLLLLPFLVGGLLYIPGIQNALRRQAEVLVARHLGMELSIGRIRLTFPLRLVVTQTLPASRSPGRWGITATPCRGWRPGRRSAL